MQLEEVKSCHQAEILALQDEKNKLISDLQQSEASVRNFESVLEKQSEKISTLDQANDLLQKHICTLTEQSQQIKFELQREIKATQEEKDAVLTKLKQSEDSVQNLMHEVTQLKDELSVQLENNSTLDKQLEEVTSSMHAKIAALRADKDATLLELQIAFQMQNENISTLQHAKDELQKNICTLTEQSEQAKAELQQEIKATQEEKHGVLTKLKQSEDSVQNLTNEVTQLKDELSVQLENNSTLENQLEEAILRVSNLQQTLEKVQAKAACQIDGMSTKTKDLEQTIDLLSYQKTKLEEDLKIMIEACTVNMSLMTKFEDRVTQKISDHEAGLVVLGQSLKGVASSCQRLQDAYDEVSLGVSQLEILKSSQIEQIGQLEERHKETLEKYKLLEEEIFSANKENTKLQKYIHDLEVHLQLAKQKLKVTEAESKCKEDRYATAAKKSQAEIHHLEQLVKQFSERVSLLEETLMQVKGHAASGVKVLRKKLDDHLDEQKELVKENDEMAVRLREKEKLLSEMVTNSAAAEAKIVQLEKTVAEKEEELAARVQRKKPTLSTLFVRSKKKSAAEERSLSLPRTDWRSNNRLSYDFSGN
jgi:chromosome segregation ATPase